MTQSLFCNDLFPFCTYSGNYYKHKELRFDSLFFFNVLRISLDVDSLSLDADSLSILNISRMVFIVPMNRGVLQRVQ